MNCKRLVILVAAGLAGLWISAACRADVRLPKVFGPKMVLQREMPIPVWGWAEPGEKITVKLGSGRAETATAGDDGAWRVNLPAQPAGGPTDLTVSGKNTIRLENVLIGEVWLCSGQSNMEWVVANCDRAADEIAAADYPQIRHIQIPKTPAGFPQDDVNAEWTVCTPETAGSYTAVGFFFGRSLHKELKVPVGLVNSSWGGTRIEPWTPPCGFAGEPNLADIYRQVKLTDPADPSYKARLRTYLEDLETWLGKAKTALAGELPLDASPAYPVEILPLASHQAPSTLYNGMIHPLVPFAIRGAIWYQGESNHTEGMLYFDKMKALVGGWRQVWNQGAFPFLYVQIAPYQYGSEPTILPAFWEAQAKALEIPNTGMAVVHDIGNLKDIHPRNKQDVGARLARIALAKTYGREGLVYSGPTFKSLALEGGKLRVMFDHVGGGLVARDGKPLNWFEIIGEETDFVPAEAAIDGDSVVLSSPEVKRPVAVRFAWHKLAEPNLANKEGLPAVPFRAGEAPERDWLALKVDEAKQYTLVYDLDLARLGAEIQYNVDRRSAVSGPFDRIAYFLELQKAGESTKYVYVSMDAFTDDLSKIAVPTAASKARFQQAVGKINVVSNVPGIVTGTALEGGNIEFWPNNYGPANTANVPNASGDLWDFGDEMSAAPVDGYGSMQVHNHQARQTLFAINQWKDAATADIGIGNSEGKTRDWTFTSNASQYEVKRLRVLVRTTGK